jgi:hypothetical protein
MKTFKICILLFIGFANNLFAQNDQSSMDDISRIALRPMLMYSPELSETSRNMLHNKVAQIASNNGLGAKGAESRFVLTAKIVVISKGIIESAPPMFAYTLEISFYIVDNREHLIFSQYTFAKKGVGDSEVKAMSSVIQQINPSDARLGVFITKGKEAILEYYNANCDIIIEKATALIENNEVEKGFELLLNIPSVNRECYDRSMELVRDLSNKSPEYSKMISAAKADDQSNFKSEDKEGAELDWIGN